MPPCNCHPPFPRPEPFSPLPRPGKAPDWGKWIRDRLAEKGALLVFPTRASFPGAGEWPNLYLDLETGAVYRWDREDYAVLVDPREGNDVLVYDSVAAFPDEGEQGKLYIAANAGSLHRWGGEGYVALLEGKADKAVPQTADNFAALTQDGNLADSGKRPSDFATAEQGARADTAVQPADLPEELPNPQALKFWDGTDNATASGGSSYDGSAQVVIPKATNTAPGLVKLIDSVTDSYSKTSGHAATPAAVKTVNDKVTAIEGKIPSQASASNQLADKEFVNSSVVTNTATFRGTFNLVTDLQLPLNATHEQVAAAVKTKLGQTAYDKNDYVFVQVPQDAEHTDAMKQVDRYKCVETGTDPVVKSWEYEWTLNNSSFTAAQWAAINSGITSGDVTKLGGIAAGAQVNVIETVKVNGTALTPQDKAVNIPVPTFDNAVTKDSANGVKSSGIWSAIWGALASLPTGFSSLYDWCVSQLAGKQNRLTPASVTTSGGIKTVWAEVKRQDSIVLVRLPTEGITVNGKPLSSNVTLTGADIAVSGTDATKIDAALTGKASKADATLTEKWMPTFSLTEEQKEKFSQTPGASDNDYALTIVPPTSGESYTLYVGSYNAAALRKDPSNITNLIFTGGDARLRLQLGDLVATLSGYQLGNQDDKLIASEAEAEALRQGKADRSDLDPLLFAWYYPDGSVKSAAEFTAGIKYDDPDTVNRTITVKPFCETDTPANDNSSLIGRVVIPPFVDAQGNPYISDDGTRYKVVGVSGGSPIAVSGSLRAIVAPCTVANIGDGAFYFCGLLADVALPAATGIGDNAFTSCTSLISVDFGDTPRSSVPSLGANAFSGVQATCKIIVPYTQYDAWIAADGWKDLPQEFVRHAENAAKPTTFTAGNLAALDANGNPTDSGVKASAKLDSTSAAPAFSSDSSVSYPVGSHVTYNGKLYKCTTATTGGTWVAGSWTAEDMTTPDATLDVTATDKLLRLVATNGDVIWGQGYNLSTESSATVLTEQVGAFTFAADAAADQAIVLPTVASGKVGDFILDVTNLSANDRSLTLTGLDSAFSVVVKAGDDLSETLTVAAGEMARYYFTMTAFRVNSLPTWQVAKEAVENGGAQS